MEAAGVSQIGTPEGGDNKIALVILSTLILVFMLLGVWYVFIRRTDDGVLSSLEITSTSNETHNVKITSGTQKVQLDMAPNQTVKVLMFLEKQLSIQTKGSTQMTNFNYGGVPKNFLVYGEGIVVAPLAKDSSKNDISQGIYTNPGLYVIQTNKFTDVVKNRAGKTINTDL